MHLSSSILIRPVIKGVLALQTYLFSRPRLDVDIINDPVSPFGQKSLGISLEQDHAEPIAIPYVKYDLQFYWNYKLRIKNNSSKTAYGVKIEEIYKLPTDYLSKLDDLAALKDNELLELDYRLYQTASITGSEAKNRLSRFPWHLDKIEIIISYTNEARKRFYTRCTISKEKKFNEHLLRNPRSK